MSLCATTEDLRRMFFHPKGFDIKNPAVPTGYRLLVAGETLSAGDIYWNKARQEWNYTAVPSGSHMPATEGMYYRKATTERVWHDVPHQPGRFNA